jgi:type II secretory pathway component GspD/PulD (secretin)
MFMSIRKHRLFVFGFVLAWALSHRAIENVAVAQNEERPVPGDRVRKKLEQIISFDYSGQSFREAIAHVQERTQLSISIDPIAMQQVGVVDGVPLQIELKNSRSKVRQALQGFLQNHGLTYVILEDNILITTEDNAVARQMSQRFPIEIKDVPATKALRDVARQAGLNLVVDPRASKIASTNVTLELEDATVLTSLRLIAEFVDLKAVRMGNVIFVTDPVRAERIRKEEAATTPPSLDPRALMGGVGINAGPAIAGGGVIQPINEKKE